MTQIDCKVVLLGNANSGKTCLLDRYVHGRFNDKTHATIGGAFSAKTEEVGKKSVVLGCWDTAGDERYATMSRMYYRKARAAILCYDLTNRTSFNRARHWVSELLNTEEDCKIYLCGTKKDLVTDDNGRREIEIESQRVLGQDLGADVFETSSRTGENVEALFRKIAKDFAISELDCDALSRHNGCEHSIKLSWRYDPRIAQAHSDSLCCQR